MENFPTKRISRIKSRPWRNRLFAKRPCFFTLIGSLCSCLHSPTRWDQANAIARTPTNFCIRSGSVIWVSSKWNPRLFKQPNSVSISHLRRYTPIASWFSSEEATISCSPSSQRTPTRKTLMPYTCLAPRRTRCSRYFNSKNNLQTPTVCPLLLVAIVLLLILI